MRNQRRRLLISIIAALGLLAAVIVRGTLAQSPVLRTIQIGADPTGLVLATRSAHAFVASKLAHTVYMLDTNTGSIVAAFHPNSPSAAISGLGLDPVGGRVYISMEDGTSYMPSAATGALLGTQSAASQPAALPFGTESRLVMHVACSAAWARTIRYGPVRCLWPSRASRTR